MRTSNHIDAAVRGLATPPLFRSLSETHLVAVRQSARDHRVAAGEVVVSAGDPDRRLFVIIEGAAVVQRRLGTPLRLEAGTHFGELASIDGFTRTATVVAATDLYLLSFAHFNVRSFAREYPEIGMAIARSLCDVARRESRLDVVAEGQG